MPASASRCCATIPSSRFEPERIDDLVGRVRSTAMELSRLLNYSPEKMQAMGRVVNL